MNSKIKDHFKKTDLKLFKALEKIEDGLEEILPILPQEYFFRLCRGIISQQLSGRVVDTFTERFIALFPNKKISPKALLKLSEEKLRGIGISWAKVKYLIDLASKVENKEVVLQDLPNLKNEEVILHLTKVKGIGRWTAEMFLMFSLGRPDIFSYGDLGLRRGIEKIYKIQNPEKSIVEKLSQKWAPYRTWACRVLWGFHDIK